MDNFFNGSLTDVCDFILSNNARIKNLHTKIIEMESIYI